MLAGWDGSPDPAASQRIRDLAEVEGWLGAIYFLGLAIVFGKRWLNSINVNLSLPPLKCSKIEIASLYCCEGC